MIKLFPDRKEKLPELDIKDDEIVSPADGLEIALSEVNDPVFSKGTMGKGVAFRYDGNDVTICSPANGSLSMVFPTGHAFGITMKSGVEIMIHIGIDTVESNGEGFKILLPEGRTVRAGQPVIKVSMAKLKQKYDMTTMLIITNANDHNIEFAGNGEVKRGTSVAIVK